MNVPSPVIVGKSMQPVDDPILPYPATFAEIVELIKSGKPIPGTFSRNCANSRYHRYTGQNSR